MRGDISGHTSPYGIAAVILHNGRNTLQIPGLTNVQDRVLQAIAAPAIDHRDPESTRLIRDIIPGLGQVFSTEWPPDPIVIANEDGRCPYPPPANLLHGPREALRMLNEERPPAEYSASVTAVIRHDGQDTGKVR